MSYSRRLIFYTSFLFLLNIGGCQNTTKTGGETESIIEISPEDLKVGEESIVRVTITSPKGGIVVGGGFRFPFYMKPWNGLIKGVTEDKESNSLVAISRSDGGKAEAVNVLTNPQWDILSDLKVLITETPLPEGETLTIQYGTDDQKVVVGRKQMSLFLEVELDENGDGEYKKLAPPLLPIAESEPTKLYLVAPSHVLMGVDFDVVAYGEDKHSNVCEEYVGRLDISPLDDSGGGDHMSYQMVPWDQNVDLDRNSFSYSFDQKGIYYIKAVDHEFGISAVSNPIIVSDSKPDKNLVWGEIHVHSQLSDGRGELQDVYRDGYARGLDFIAITDHGFGRSDRGSLEERINEICREADRFNRPGEFVAVPAGETHYLPVMHMNMYFDEANPEKMLSLANSIDKITKDLRKNWKEMTQDQLAEEVVTYWDVFKNEIYKDHTLVFPHHTMWLGIKPFLDTERTRVIEVYSVHGTSEIRNQKNTPKALQMKPGRMKGDQDQKISVRELLNEGMKLGFVGGSDNHEGQAGYNAITGVYSRGLNRTSIIRGIYDQECYATSSNRTLIEVEPDGENYRCLVAGDGELDKIEIIHNGEPVYEPENISGRICMFNWTPEPQEGYFYVKVLLSEGTEAAWSSPIWLE